MVRALEICLIVATVALAVVVEDVGAADPQDPLGPQACVTAASAGDCRRNGQFVCIGAFPGAAGGLFGFCQANKTAPGGWNCCRLPVAVPAMPAPPRSASYPLPPTEQPAPGKANIVFFLTDDQDYRLGSLDVMNVTRELFSRGGTELSNFRVVLPICCPSRVTILR